MAALQLTARKNTQGVSTPEVIVSPETAEHLEKLENLLDGFIG
jgi:hypothetical protein